MTQIGNRNSAIGNITLFVFDVDGVLTDGGIYVDDTGNEFKKFHVRDGMMMRAAQKVGYKIGIISARPARMTALRMTDLKVDAFVQGEHDKASALRRMCDQLDVEPAQTAFMGDDLFDLPALRISGYPVTVADAPQDVKQFAEYVTQQPGGHGAVREAIEHVIKAQGRWEELIGQYVG